MILYGKVKNGQAIFVLDKWEDKKVIADIELLKDQRTLNQNNALHLLFKQLSDQMMENGIDDMRMIIRDEVPISPTPYMIKEFLWKPLQKVMLGKKSTTRLNKNSEINQVYDQLNKILSERSKGIISLPPFPSIDNLTK